MLVCLWIVHVCSFVLSCLSSWALWVSRINWPELLKSVDHCQYIGRLYALTTPGVNNYDSPKDFSQNSHHAWTMAKPHDQTLAFLCFCCSQAASFCANLSSNRCRDKAQTAEVCRKASGHSFASNIRTASTFAKLENIWPKHAAVVTLPMRH